MNTNNIYLIAVIMITSIALFILVGFLINKYVISKKFLKIFEDAGGNDSKLLLNSYNYIWNLSISFFGLVYLVLITQIIILILTKYYYNHIREIKGDKGDRGLRGRQGPKGPPGKCK